jgi:ACS family tartrate transporter-like MFS transporter
LIEHAPPVATEDLILKSALRKASVRILPLIALGYGTAYMDRVNISFASIQMNRDLHFSATVYGFGAGIFFLSYALCEVPSNLALYRFGARRWLARIMVTWGLIATGMLFVRTPLEFYVIRFLLGMAEAGFFPGVIFYLMLWFPPEMRARTVTRFYVSWPLSTVFMGTVAGALLNLNGRCSLSGWQWLFLVEALPAVLLGLVYLFCLPDGPADAKWLTEAERGAILASVRRGPIQPHTHSVLPALRDRRVLLLGVFMFCMLASSYAYAFSAPAILLKVTGFSVTNVGFVIAAMNLLGAVAILANGILSDRRRAPFAHIIPGCFMMAFGFIVFGLATSPIVSVTALLVMALGHFSMQGPLWAIATSFLSGRSAAAAIAAMNTIGIVGGFVGPYWMGIAKDLTGNYQRGLLTMSVPMLLAAGIMLHLRPARVPAEAAAVPSLP